MTPGRRSFDYAVHTARCYARQFGERSAVRGIYRNGQWFYVATASRARASLVRKA